MSWILCSFHYLILNDFCHWKSIKNFKYLFHNWALLLGSCSNLKQSHNLVHTWANSIITTLIKFMSWKYGMFPKDLYLVQGFKTSCHRKISLPITNRLEIFIFLFMNSHQLANLSLKMQTMIFFKFGHSHY
jgi:hypothetical protein